MAQTTLTLTLYILLFAFLFGAVFGSYIDCVAWRLVHQEPVARGRSHCDACGHPLGAGDLIPIISYLRSRGHCRYCGAKISPESSFVELALGLGFAVLVYKYDVSFVALRYLGLLVILMGLSLVDQKTYLIPDRFHVAGILWWLFTLPLIAYTKGQGLTAALSTTGAKLPLGNAPGLQDGLGRIIATSASAQATAAMSQATSGTALSLPPVQWMLTDLQWGLVSALGIGLFMLLLSLLFEKLTGKESLGGGDIKLFFMIGLYLRPGVALFNLILSCLVGLFFALGLKKEKLPFGPSISLATFFSILFGSEFVAWYTSLIF
ncbi:MAG TPA: hypothetical protein DD632_03665 [Oribacterium sp.]|nr:hypothetical protein [Oribacterium sp.]HCS67825.1 hypothetical protein [Oribacterium sp.]